jgi:enoyl-CoA hydratase/carnithine racemase
MSFTTFSTQQDGPVMTVSFSQGEVNIMTAVMAAELFALVGQLAVDTETRVVVFESATPDFFIAHFNVADILKLLEGDPSIPISKDPGLNILQALGLSLQSLPQVTVAKIDGRCRGGGFEFMLALDMSFATEASMFCFPEAAVGFLPSGGGATLLPLKAGRNRALEVMLTSRDFSGTEAAQYGFINRTFASAAQLDEYVTTSARQMAARGLPVIQAIKAVSGATVASMKDGVLAGLAQENASMVACLSDPDVLARLKGFAAAEGTRESELDLPATLDAL